MNAKSYFKKNKIKTKVTIFKNKIKTTFALLKWRQ